MSSTEATYACQCVVGSNGEDDAENIKYFVVTDDGTGLTHTVSIERHQIVEVIRDYSNPDHVGSPYHRRDRLCEVLLTALQMKELGLQLRG